MAEPLTPTELQTWLEWAGGKLLSLGIASPAPAGYRTARIDYLNDSGAYGYTNETIRAPRVRADEVAIMDQILLLPALADNLTIRRVLHRRALVTPISGRYLHTYKAIAKELHLDARLAARLHLKGLAQVAKRVPKAQVRLLREFMASHVIFS